jgi:hypothetical protein
VDAAVPGEPARGGDAAAQHGRDRGLVDLHHDLGRAAEPAADVGNVRPETLRERLGQLAPGAVVGQHLVAARALHGRGQGQRPGHLHLHGAGEVSEVLLGGVEVLGQHRAGPPQVAPRADTETPAGRLQVGLQPVEHGQAASDHPGVRAARGQLGHEGEVADLAPDDTERLVDVGAGHRPDARGPHPDWVVSRRVCAIVADPTTRVPS